MSRSPSLPAPPRVSPPDLPRDLAPGTPARRADLHRMRLDDLSGDIDLSYGIAEQCALSGTVGRLDLTGTSLIDVEIQNLKATEFIARETNVRRVRIVGGRIGTLDLSGARIAELELRDVRIDYLSLSGAKGEDILITDCALRAIDVPLATVKRVSFMNCRAEELDSRGFRASSVDLRGLDVTRILDPAGLRGVTLDYRQVIDLAPALAAAAGIQIAE